MTGFTLADAIGSISEKQVQRALNYKRRANKLLWLAPIAACLIITLCIIPTLGIGVSPDPISNSTETGSDISAGDKNPGGTTDDKNPGGATSCNNALSYNGEYFEFGHCVIRIVYDENERIIEPVKANWDDDIRATLEAADRLSELQYLGTGEVIGTDPHARLYMMPSGNILAVRPCILEPYMDAEELLEKYSEDRIFEIFTFIKADTD